MAKKRVNAVIKLQVPAGQATPAPPVGPALGPHGVSAPQFVQQFKRPHPERRAGTHHPGGVITVFADRTFSFETKTPPAAVLIKKAIGLEKGSPESNREKVGSISRAALEEIAQRKMQDLNANDVQAAAKVIAGTARSMGVTVED